MSVNFKELKRKEIRKTFGEGEGQVIVYNPDSENRKKIEAIIEKFRKSNKEEINPQDIILDILPLTTNVCLDLDRNNKNDLKIIEEIIADPSPIFEDTIFEVTELTKEIAVRYYKTLNNLINLPKEELDKLMEQFKEETPEEKELRELKERQKELESKLNNKNEE